MAITPLTLYTGQVPLIGQTQAVFDQNAGDILVYLSDFGTDINGRAVEIDAVGVSADADATTATTKAGEANTSAINALASETASELSEWESEASRLTAVSYATEAEDVVVNIVTSDGDGTYTYTPQTGVYSALHHELKAATFNPSLYVTLDSPALVNPTINGVAQSGYTGFKNYLINGAFDIWQRGEGYTADRFHVFYFSGNIVKNGATSTPQGFPNHLSVTKTAGQDTQIIQRWEMPLNKCKTFLNGRTLTFSAWVLTSVGIDKIYFIKGGVATNSFEIKDFSITKSPTLNTWSKIEGTISNINFAYEDGSHVEIRMDPSNVGAGTIHTTGWQLEEGSVATPFEHRPIGLELSLCQRYFRQVAYKWFGTAENLYIYGSSVPFGVEMRVSPTVVYSSAYGDQNGFNTPSITLTTSKSCVVVATATASGSNKQFGAIFNASAEL